MSFLSFIIIVFFLRILSSNAAVFYQEQRNVNKSNWNFLSKKHNCNNTFDRAFSVDWRVVTSSFMVASFSSHSLFRLKISWSIVHVFICNRYKMTLTESKPDIKESSWFSFKRNCRFHLIHYKPQRGMIETTCRYDCTNSVYWNMKSLDKTFSGILSCKWYRINQDATRVHSTNIYAEVQATYNCSNKVSSNLNNSLGF